MSRAPGNFSGSGGKQTPSILLVVMITPEGKVQKAIIWDDDPLFLRCKEELKINGVKVHSVYQIEEIPEDVPYLCEFLNLNEPGSLGITRMGAARRPDVQQRPRDEVLPPPSYGERATYTGVRPNPMDRTDRYAQTLRDMASVQSEPETELMPPTTTATPATAQTAEDTQTLETEEAKTGLTDRLTSLWTQLVSEDLNKFTPLKIAIGFFISQYAYSHQLERFKEKKGKRAVVIIFAAALTTMLAQTAITAFFPASVSVFDWLPITAPLPLPTDFAPDSVSRAGLYFVLLIGSSLLYATAIKLALLKSGIPSPFVKILTTISAARIIFTFLALALLIVFGQVPPFLPLFLFGLLGTFALYRIAALLTTGLGKEKEEERYSYAAFLLLIFCAGFTAALSPSLQAAAELRRINNRDRDAPTYLNAVSSIIWTLDDVDARKDLTKFMEKVAEGAQAKELLKKRAKEIEKERAQNAAGEQPSPQMGQFPLAAEIIGARNPKNPLNFSFKIEVAILESSLGPFVAQWDANFDGKNFKPTIELPLSARFEHSYDAEGRYTAAARIKSNAGKTSKLLYFTLSAGVPPLIKVAPPLPFMGISEVEPVIIRFASSPAEAAELGYKVQFDFEYDARKGFISTFSVSKTSEVTFYPPKKGRYLVAMRGIGGDGVFGQIATLDVAVGTEAMDAQFYDQGPYDEGSSQILRAHPADASDMYAGGIYEWDASYDGKNFVARYSSGDRPYLVYSFPDSGEWRVAYRMVDKKGATVKFNDKLTVKVANLPPVAKITPKELGNDAFSFIASCIDPSTFDTITAIEWDINFDGKTFKPSKELSGKYEITVKTPKNASTKIGLRCADNQGAQSSVFSYNIPKK